MKKSINHFMSVISNRPFYSHKKKTSLPQVLKWGQKAIDLKFKSPDGKEIALSSLKGKSGVTRFFGHLGAAPCRREKSSSCCRI
jgi:hypothetical protein